MALYFYRLSNTYISKCLIYGSTLGTVTKRKAYLHLTGSTKSNRSQCPDKPFYHIRLALPPDYENVLNFMAVAYYKYEPTMVNSGLSRTEAPAPFMKLMYDEIGDGMTLIAEDDKHCILGVSVNVKSCPWEPDRWYEFARCCASGLTRDVIEFFAYVAQKSNLWERFCVQTIFEVSCLAVDPEFHGFGIARKLLEESWYLARDCGYRLFRLDCTNRHSTIIADAFGWEKVATVPYCRYVKNGELVFKYIKEPHTEIQIYADQLTYNKTYKLPYRKK